MLIKSLTVSPWHGLGESCGIKYITAVSRFTTYYYRHRVATRPRSFLENIFLISIVRESIHLVGLSYGTEIIHV